MNGVEQFVEDDPGYLDWVTRHPDGFVINTGRTPTVSYVLIGLARQLVLSEHTVHPHLANILRKLGLSSRAAAAARAVRAGLV